MANQINLSKERQEYLIERLGTRIRSLEIHERNGFIGSSQQETLDAFRIALSILIQKE